jgi:hypothetical protein
VTVAREGYWFFNFNFNFNFAQVGISLIPRVRSKWRALCAKRGLKTSGIDAELEFEQVKSLEVNSSAGNFVLKM